MSDDAPATPAPAKTTTAGAALVQSNAWIVAAAVAVYSTRAIWMRLNKIGKNKDKKQKELEDVVEDLNEDVEEELNEDDKDPKEDVEAVKGNEGTLEPLVDPMMQQDQHQDQQQLLNIDES